jgi:RimJ/RimL family protein N-acetyltransferase
VSLELRGERVLLRPLRPDELDVLAAPHEGVVEFLGGSLARERLRHRIEHSGRFFEGRLDLGIDLDGRLVGSVEARRPRGALPPGVYELGIALFATSDRGRGYGTEAIRLMADHLFAAMGAERVQASTDLGNAAMDRVLEKLGFVREGVMRGFMPTPGGRADYVLYGVTKAEWLA